MTRTKSKKQVSKIKEQVTQKPTNQQALAYKLETERAAIQAKLRKLKKEVSDLRASIKESEFNFLKNPENGEEIYKEHNEETVKTWSKYVGLHFDKVTFLNQESDETKNWFIQCSVKDLKFEINMSFVSDKSSKKGKVVNLLVKVLNVEYKEELQSWLAKADGNIVKIFKGLKVYAEKNQAREAGLNECKQKFGEIINLSRDKGFVVIDLLNSNGSLMFQIHWKLDPCKRNIASVRNKCSMSCTEEGTNLLRSMPDGASIMRLLQSDPIKTIHLLTERITQL